MGTRGPEPRRLEAQALQAPPPVEPRLPLVEEILLLSLDAPRHKVREAVAIAGDAHPQSRGYRDAMRSLKHRGLISGRWPFGSLAATPAAKVDQRHRRLLGVIRSPPPARGADAELFVLLAAAGALTFGRDDHLRARTQIASIARRGELQALLDRIRENHGAESVQALGDYLFPPEHDFHLGRFGPATGSGAGMYTGSS